MIDCLAVIPAKKTSHRVPAKNLRSFWNGMSLLEIKIRVLKQCNFIKQIIVSSDDEKALALAKSLGAYARLRSSDLCNDFVNLKELFQEVLAEFDSNLIYWAHPTSPFVKPVTIDKAIELAKNNTSNCIIGVEHLQEFLWSEEGPINYDPKIQPRSQELPPLYRITGGIHIAVAHRFIEEGSLAFNPLMFFNMSKIESLDINTEDDWELCVALSNAAMPSFII